MVTGDTSLWFGIRRNFSAGPVTLLELSKQDQGRGNNVASALDNLASTFVQWSQSRVQGVGACI